MGDGDALYNAIVANPDDDTPRLVYADWIAGDSGWDDAEEKAVWLREQVQTNGDLQRQSFHDEPVPFMNGFGFVTDYRYRRGFIEEVKVRLLKNIIGPDGYPTTEAIGIARRFPIRKWELSRYAWNPDRYVYYRDQTVRVGGPDDIAEYTASCEAISQDYIRLPTIPLERTIRYTESFAIRGPVCSKLAVLIRDHPRGRDVSRDSDGGIQVFSSLRNRQPHLIDALGECLAKWVHKYAFPEDVK